MTELAKAPPAFQFYASDTMADRRYRSMNLSERGLLLSILCECWVNRSAPADTVLLSKILGFTKQEIEEALTDRVVSFFKTEDGELVNTGLAEYRQRLDAGKANMAKGGRRGANARWRKDSTNNASSNDHPINHPINYPNRVSMGSRVEQSRAEPSREEPNRRDIESNEDTTSTDPWITAYSTHATNFDSSQVEF